MQLFYKGVYVSELHGKQNTAIFRVLIDAHDWLTSPEINALAQVEGSGTHINKLKKNHNIRVDIDDSNKAKHKYRIKEGYKLI